MGKASDRDDTNPENETVELGRRDTLRLATLAAALGAGLSVSFHTDEASADAAQQLQIKFYRQAKEQSQLVHTAVLPPEVSKRLLEAPGLVQFKCYSSPGDLLGASQMQLKLEQPKQAPAPTPPTGWDVSKNKKL
jgi:hypothetical protein